MSDDNDDEIPMVPFRMILGQHKPPTPQEELERRKQVANFAKASLEHLKTIQRSARDVVSLYRDTPIVIDEVAEHIKAIRESNAILIEMLEGLTEL